MLEQAKQRLHDADTSTEKGIEAAIVALSRPGDSDELLYWGLKDIKRNSSTDRKALRRVMAELSGFYLDSTCVKLATWMQSLSDKFHDEQRKQALYEEDLAGMQLLNRDGTQGVLFLPDASEPGRYRASFFDQGGFYSHLTRDTYRAVLDEVWLEGFRPTVTPMLEVWAVQQRWSEGSDVTLAIQQVELGNMAFEHCIGIAQWHSNKAIFQAWLHDLGASGLEPSQQRQQFSAMVHEQYGLSLRQDVITSLMADPHQKPPLEKGLFVSASFRPAHRMAVEKTPDCSPTNSPSLGGRKIG